MSDSPIAEFGGKCAFALSVGPAAKAPQGDPRHMLIRGAKMYLFAAAVPKLLFQIIPGSAARAQQRWESR